MKIVIFPIDLVMVAWGQKLKNTFSFLWPIIHLSVIYYLENAYGRGRDAGYPAPPAQIRT